MWQLHGFEGQFTSNRGSWQLDTRRPAHGLHHIALGGNPVDGLTLFRIDTSWPPQPEKTLQQTDASLDAGLPVAEQYVRGGDLIVSYPQLPGRTVRPQVYWRALQCSGELDFGVEVVLSIETDLLDSQPQTRTCSELSATTVRWCTSDGQWRDWSGSSERLSLSPRDALPLVLVELGDDWHYLEMLYPADFGVLALAPANHGAVQICWSLFDEFLEKGVIRRGRLRGIFHRGSNPEAWAHQQLAEFAASQLPLTT